VVKGRQAEALASGGGFADWTVRMGVRGHGARGWGKRARPFATLGSGAAGRGTSSFPFTPMMGRAPPPFPRLLAGTAAAVVRMWKRVRPGSGDKCPRNPTRKRGGARRGRGGRGVAELGCSNSQRPPLSVAGWGGGHGVPRVGWGRREGRGKRARPWGEAGRGAA
jgi:hypothetical protein